MPVVFGPPGLERDPGDERQQQPAAVVGDATAQQALVTTIVLQDEQPHDQARERRRQQRHEQQRQLRREDEDQRHQCAGGDDLPQRPDVARPSEPAAREHQGPRSPVNHHRTLECPSCIEAHGPRVAHGPTNTLSAIARSHHRAERSPWFRCARLGHRVKDAQLCIRGCPRGAAAMTELSCSASARSLACSSASPTPTHSRASST